MKKMFTALAVVFFFSFVGGAQAFVSEAIFFTLFDKMLDESITTQSKVETNVTTAQEQTPDIGQLTQVNKLWVKFIPKVDMTMDEPDTMIYGSNGKKVKELKSGQAYFLTSLKEYTNFVPENGDELTFLAIPGTRVKRVENGGAIIKPLTPWKKPVNTAEIKYTVHFGSAQDRPAGSKITGEFTGWAEAQKVTTTPGAEAPTAEVPAETPIVIPASKGKNDDLWAKLRSDVAGQPAPAPTVKPVKSPVITELVEPVAIPTPQPVLTAPEKQIVLAPQPKAVTETKQVSKLWSRVVFTTDTPVGAGSWVFSLGGEQLSTGETAKANQSYYLVDPSQYTNFVPKSWKDFGELQFPGTRLEREGDFGARFVRPVGAWKKPSGQNFIIHYNSSQNRPAGYVIEGVFTGWVLPK